MGKIDLDMKRDKIKKIKDRFVIIEKYVKGKEVLDLGCINHDVNEERQDDWLHGFIAKKAKYALGVDYLPKEVAKLKKKGYNIICADVEKMDLGRKFDVVVAGELIEHLNNFGLFLERARAHLKKGGHLIITTPNAFSGRNLLRGIVLGVVPTNREHSCIFDAKTLKNLVERNGFRVIERYYFFDDTHKWTHRVEKALSALRDSLTPEMIYVCMKE